MISVELSPSALTSGSRALQRHNGWHGAAPGDHFAVAITRHVAQW
jgi:hypothetical protein